jgi:hypothetical protein
MSLLSGHQRIMEAAEAALVMMVLEEGWFVLGRLLNRQLSGRSELAFFRVEGPWWKKR